MKSLPYIIIIILVLFIVFRPTRVERVPGEVVRDTIITNRIDTVWGTVPVPVYESVVDSFPFVVPVPVNKASHYVGIGVSYDVFEW